MCRNITQEVLFTHSCQSNKLPDNLNEFVSLIPSDCTSPLLVRGVLQGNRRAITFWNLHEQCNDDVAGTLISSKEPSYLLIYPHPSTATGLILTFIRMYVDHVNTVNYCPYIKRLFSFTITTTNITSRAIPTITSTQLEWSITP